MHACRLRLYLSGVRNFRNAPRGLTPHVYLSGAQDKRPVSQHAPRQATWCRAEHAFAEKFALSIGRSQSLTLLPTATGRACRGIKDRLTGLNIRSFLFLIKVF